MNIRQLSENSFGSCFLLSRMSQVSAHACMKALIWRTVITEKKCSGFEVLPEGNRVGVSLLDPNEPSKCSCLHESTYLANGNHREGAQRIRGVTGGKSSRSQPTRFKTTLTIVVNHEVAINIFCKYIMLIL